MGYRDARRLHVLLMVWLTVTLLATWLPLLRGAFDGPSYQWGTGLLGFRFGGAGLGGDYPFLVVKAAVALALVGSGWRRPNGAFRPALVAWLAVALVDTLFNAITAPGEFRFHGDTLGVDVSLAVAAPALDAAMLGIAMWWSIRAPALPVPPLARANMVLLTAAALLLPVQYVLLSSGRGQQANDVVGVLLTIAGWFLLSAGLGLWRLARPRPLTLAAAS